MPTAIGFIWAMAFPFASISGFAWIVPGSLFLLAAFSQKSPFRSLYGAGLVYYLTTLYWLLFMPFPAGAVAGWLALSGYCALYPAVWGLLIHRLWHLKNSSTAPHAFARFSSLTTGRSWLSRQAWILMAASTWVSLEWLLTHLFTGFPWNFLGVSQLRLLPLVQIASITGVYGVSFLVVFGSLSLVFALSTISGFPSQPWQWAREIILPSLLVGGSWIWGTQYLRDLPRDGEPFRIALVQPSIPQTLIWDDSPESRKSKFDKIMSLSREALAHSPGLLVWPESAMPPVTPEDLAEIIGMIRSHKCWFVFGELDEGKTEAEEVQFFNTAFLMSPTGEIVERYHKRRLVIFGEYVPLAKWLPFLKWFTPIDGGFTEGTGNSNFTLSSTGTSFGNLICFEDAFPHLARDHTKPTSSFLLNITNDGWFGESAEQWQHAQNAAFRAIENAVPLVRCANNGVSCLISSSGKIDHAYSPESENAHEAGIRVFDVATGREHRTTFYNRHGDVFAFACLLITLGAVIASVIKRRDQAN